MKQQTLIPHLFRTEYSKIVAVLCKRFGIAHIEVAEDIASETFLLALETWPFKGIPDNPIAWLHTVAKNRTKNYLNRHHLFHEKISSQMQHVIPEFQQDEIDLSEHNIVDSQLQMLFTLCHPAISAEAQIGLSLRVLCGFGIDEIANAFLTNKETINKRLFRAKEKLRLEKVPIEFPKGSEMDKRLDAVLTTLYLLFNEGYYSESKDAVLREDLCLEAMRLTYFLIKNKQTNLTQVNALFALMCFHASRFGTRKNENGEVILYQDQDEFQWNKKLIYKGTYYLKQASQGTRLSKYHLEANIAYWHTIKEDKKEKWENILQLYNQLLVLEYSPIAVLNRTYALSKVKSKAEAILEAEKLQLTDNPFYFSLLGELHRGIDKDQAKQNFQRALQLAKTNPDKRTLQRYIDELQLI